MNTTPREHIVSIRQEIDNLEQDYSQALEQGKQFDVLKKIRLAIRELEEIFNKQRS